MTEDSNELEKERPKPFTTQFNMWLGRKGRIWYLIFGFGLAVATLWSFYAYVLRPEFSATYTREIQGLKEDKKTVEEEKRNELNNLRQDKDRVIDNLRNDKDAEIRKLQAQITDWEITIRNLKDTLETLRTIGLFWGTYQIPYTPDSSYSGDVHLPLFGKRLRALANSWNKQYYLDLIIDTCEVHSIWNTERSPCSEIEITYFPLSPGNYSPLQIGKELYYFKCRKITDEFIEVDLYKSSK